jgi:flagellar FliL protein
MSVTADDIQTASTAKRSRMPLLIGLVLALAGGAGGFFAIKTGFAESVLVSDHAGEEALLPPITPAAFLALDPLIINLPDPTERRFLRFVAQVEVAPEHLADVEAIEPRIVDVLNGYLRAVEITDLESPASLARLRAQMLRRVQVVVGGDRVRDLLIMEFVLN